MSNRRKEREYAFKIIFANHFNEQSVDEVSQKLLETDPSSVKYLTDFSKQLAADVILNANRYDQLIESKLKNWTLDRINISDRLLLQMALSEFEQFDDIPAEVTIYEIIELAKQYGTEKSMSFINGLLDAVHQDQKGSQV